MLPPWRHHFRRQGRTLNSTSTPSTVSRMSYDSEPHQGPLQTAQPRREDRERRVEGIVFSRVVAWTLQRTQVSGLHAGLVATETANEFDTANTIPRATGQGYGLLGIT
jgi:hypothetical protein